jgi:hypothetical protein
MACTRDAKDWHEVLSLFHKVCIKLQASQPIRNRLYESKFHGRPTDSALHISNMCAFLSRLCQSWLVLVMPQTGMQQKFFRIKSAPNRKQISLLETRCMNVTSQDPFRVKHSQPPICTLCKSGLDMRWSALVTPKTGKMQPQRSNYAKAITRKLAF